MLKSDNPEDLEEKVKEKYTDTEKKQIREKTKNIRDDIFNLFIGSEHDVFSYKEMVLDNLIEFGKEITKPNIENFLTYATLIELPEEFGQSIPYSTKDPNSAFYMNNQYKDKKGVVHPTNKLFKLIFSEQEYHKRLKEFTKELKDYLLEKNHKEIVEYIKDKIDKRPFIKKLKIAQKLSSSPTSEKIEVDSVLLYNITKDKEELNNLFPNKPEYANALFKVLNIATEQKEKYEYHILNLIKKCGQIKKSEAKDAFYIPILLELENIKSEISNYRSIDKLLDNLKKAYVLLEKVNEFINEYKISKNMLVESRDKLSKHTYKLSGDLIRQHVACTAKMILENKELIPKNGKPGELKRLYEQFRNIRIHLFGEKGLLPEYNKMDKTIYDNIKILPN